MNTTLSDQLNKTVLELLGHHNDPKKDTELIIQTKYQRCLARLCLILEKIMEHGIKDGLFGTTYFWNYAENLDKCLPGTEGKELLKRIREFSKGSIGRGRVFVRLTLNEGTLPEYLKALLFAPNLTMQYYREAALLRNEEQVTMLLRTLETLKSCQFNFIVKDKKLDDADYWLKFAGRNKVEYSVADTSTNTAVLAPPNLTKINKNLSSTLPSIETINNIVQQAQHQESELKQASQKIAELKILVQKEKQEKETLSNDHKKLNEDFQFLVERIRDMEVELNIYKSHVAKSPMNISVDSPVKSSQDTSWMTPNSLAQAELDTNFSFNNSFENLLAMTFETTEEYLEQENIEDLMLKKLNSAQEMIQAMKSYDESIKEKLLAL